jgi:hypothetical protein
VAQATSFPPESTGSQKSILPSCTFSGEIGFDAGEMTDVGSALMSPPLSAPNPTVDGSLQALAKRVIIRSTIAALIVFIVIYLQLML